VINTECPGWRIARREASCQDAVDLGLGQLADRLFGLLPRYSLVIVCHRLQPSASQAPPPICSDHCSSIHINRLKDLSLSETCSLYLSFASYCRQYEAVLIRAPGLCPHNSRCASDKPRWYGTACGSKRVISLKPPGRYRDRFRTRPAWSTFRASPRSGMNGANFN
jgi:hypothetical protein